MKRTIRLSESDLHNIVSATVKKVLKENSWSGDINPQAIRGFQKDLNANQVEDSKRRIINLTDEMKRYALAGNSHQVEYIAKQIATCANLINQCGLDNVYDNFVQVGGND